MSIKVIASCLCLAVLSGADLNAREVGNEKLVWAHYVPWFNPLNASTVIAGFYNYPTQRSTGNQIKDYRAEIELAQKQGINGFFADVVIKPNGETHFSTQVKTMLQAAEGTTFMIAPCLDGKSSVDNQVVEVKKMLDEFGEHPNLPKINGKPILATYAWEIWTPQEWLDIRKKLKEKGHDIYLIANFDASYDRKKNEEMERYAQTFDMAYSFVENGMNGVSVKDNFTIKAAAAKKLGKDWMGVLWPGYYGSWLNGRNDYYQPHLGFDQLHECFIALQPGREKWLHLTSWNDHDETSLLPMVFTWGNAEIIRAYADKFKGIAPASGEPKVFFAYHREEIAGTLLRLEAMTIPVKDANAVNVSGKLLGIDGKVMAILSGKTLKTIDFNRTEWLISTANLVDSPFLIPEITLESGTYNLTRRLPAILLKSGWQQNPVTVKVPVHGLAELNAQLKIQQQENALNATLEFDSPDKITHAVLWRNDRPIAEFRADKPDGQLLNLIFEPAGRCAYEVQVVNGKIIKAKRNLTEKNSPEFKFSETAIIASNNLPWTPVGTCIEVNDKTRIILSVTGAEPVALSLRNIVDRHYVKLGQLTVVEADFEPASQEMAVRQSEINNGRYELNLITREACVNDLFEVRFETESGKIGYSEIIAPFSQPVPMPLPMLQTSVNLDTSSGATGMPGRNEYLSRDVPFRKPQIVNCKVHPAILRQGRWTFEHGGWDDLGDMPVRNIEKQTAEGGVNGGKCLKLDGKNPVKMRSRTYPLGAATLDFYLKPQGNRNNDQALLSREGWSSALNVVLKRDGRIEVIRNGLILKEESLCGVKALLPDKWSRVTVTFDEKTIRLYVDGVADGSKAVAPGREYGNSSWVIGGNMPGKDNFIGEVDDLTVLSYPALPSDAQFPRFKARMPETPLEPFLGDGLKLTQQANGWKWSAEAPLKTQAGDAEKVILATKSFSPAQAISGNGGATMLVGPGGSCSGGAICLETARLNNRQQIAIPLQRYQRTLVNGTTKGWTAVLISLKNSKGYAYNFNLASPENGIISANQPNWQPLGYEFTYKCPAKFIIRKMNGYLSFIVGNKKVFTIPDNLESPYDRITVSACIQSAEDAILVQVGKPELFNLQ